MDLLTSIKISASGLAANRKLISAISSNIANAGVTRTAEGGPYRPKEVVFGSEPARDSFSDILEGEIDAKAQAVHATEVISSNRPPILKYQPHHPDANKDGYVAYPDINQIAENMKLMEAHRAYEANINVMNTAKSMAMKALEIGQ